MSASVIFKFLSSDKSFIFNFAPQEYTPVIIKNHSNYNHSTLRWIAGRWQLVEADPIAPEVPLAIRLLSGANDQRVATDFAISMRSPGADKELILGYLYSEGIISHAAAVERIAFPAADMVNVYLSPEVVFDPSAYHRVGYANSSCGLCGKADLDQLEQTIPYFPAKGRPKVEPSLLTRLPAILEQRQQLFAATGGIHATALFSAEGELLALTEDIGRHNALDKLLGHALQAGLFPWRDKIVLLSGRISYELVQKAAMAGAPIIAAIGAPSSAAIDLATATGTTLVGFLKSDKMNVYTYPERLQQ